MISKKEVLEQANTFGLSPDTIEKDYVLGWMLYGINSFPELQDKWLFKGGTSLKKCFFETFRFSEDLDFTILEKNHLNIDFLIGALHEIADLISDKVGIKFDKDQFKFKINEKENGTKSGQGKIHFNGPLQRKRGFASIKLDLTNDEAVVLNPSKRKVHHPYSDNPDSHIFATCYAFEEVVAEKIRALAQRARPRDLYDVIHFFRDRQIIENPTLVYNVLGKKCAFKNIPVPTYKIMETHEYIDELKAEWENMLAHQLPSLPPIEHFWRDLEPFFNWLGGTLQEERLVPISERDEVFYPGRIKHHSRIDGILLKIQFAAANRVCIKLTYSNKVRTIEPYSFRQARNGSRLFHGFDLGNNKMISFKINQIQGIEVTNIPYMERYLVEITAGRP